MAQSLTQALAICLPTLYYSTVVGEHGTLQDNTEVLIVHHSYQA
jgi:hypothetical protein